MMRTDDRRPVITIGTRHADFEEPTEASLRAAIQTLSEVTAPAPPPRVDAQRGGTVVLAEGEYDIERSIRLYDFIALRGEGRVRIVQHCMASSPFTSDCGFAHDRVRVPNPGEWREGWTVALRDDRNASGYDVNIRTIARIEEDDLVLDEPTTEDYMVERGARVDHAYPPLQVLNASGVSIEGIQVVGDARAPVLDGCRVAGIYAFGASDLRITLCRVEGFQGDGISFQHSPGTVVTRCMARRNAGLGFHPGTGSRNCRIANCVSARNGGDGLFVCWRVDHSVFENNVIRGNHGAGISVGHKDCHNRFTGNRISRNRGHGVLVRDEADYNAAHACVFEGNRLEDNGGPETAAVAILGVTRGTRFTGNRLLETRGEGGAPLGILVGRRAVGTVVEGNELQGFAEDLRWEA